MVQQHNYTFKYSYLADNENMAIQHFKKIKRQILQLDPQAQFRTKWNYLNNKMYIVIDFSNLGCKSIFELSL